MANGNENIEIPSRGRPKKRSDLDDTQFRPGEQNASSWGYNLEYEDDYRREIVMEPPYNNNNTEMRFMDESCGANPETDVYNRIYKKPCIAQNEKLPNAAFVNTETHVLRNINTSKDKYSMYNRNENSEYNYETGMFKNDKMLQNHHNNVRTNDLVGKIIPANSRNIFPGHKRDKSNNYNERSYSNTYNAINGNKYGHTNGYNRSKMYKQSGPGNQKPRNFTDFKDSDKYDFTDKNYGMVNQMSVPQSPYMTHPNAMSIQNPNNPYPIQGQNTDFMVDNGQFQPGVFIQDNLQPASVRVGGPEMQSLPDQLMTNSWLSRKKRKNNPYLHTYLKPQDGQAPPMSPAEFSSVNYINSTENTQKMYLGTLKQSYTRAQTNNTILPLFLNSSSCYDNPSSHEFDKIATTFLQKSDNFDYENVTVQQLKVLMKEFGLSHTGKKHELIDRVKNTVNLIRDKLKMSGCKKVARIKDEILNLGKEKKIVGIKMDDMQKKNYQDDGGVSGLDWLFF